MTVLIDPAKGYGRVKVENFHLVDVPNLNDPNVVRLLWEESRRAAAEEARPDWLNGIIRWFRRDAR